MNLTIEIEQEVDGRWLAEISEIPGIMTYGKTREQAIIMVKSLVLRVLADRLEHGESIPEMEQVFLIAA
ncbi:MAG: type II toxin-antitoxin system HicB family antitoxin [Desulfobacterales bacterium]|nr:type II toxin-antitoxin system HicB family antitoxin [Desulfobacterales bacterium]